MSERAREPLFFEAVEEELQPEPSTESAGSGGLLTAVGSDLGDGGGDDERPIGAGGVRGDDPGDKGRTMKRHLGAAIRLVVDVYSTPIEDLKLSERAYEGLRRRGLTSVGSVLKKTEQELISMRNFGRESYDELRAKLDEMGILPMDVPTQ